MKLKRDSSVLPEGLWNTAAVKLATRLIQAEEKMQTGVEHL